MAEDYHIHGGVVDTVNCQGNVIMHGGVVERMNVQGDCHQYGGIIERRVQMVSASDQRTMNAINEAAERYAKPYAEEINSLRRENVELKQRLNGIGKLESLKAYNTRLSRENDQLKSKCFELRTKLDKVNIDHEPKETPPDDVLVMRIHNLENALAREKAEHEKDVEELQDRLDVACEINAQLRNRYEDDDRRSQEIADKHIDILATLMCLYPYTPDKDLEFEFGLPVDRIRYAAAALGAIKSPEARREAVDYLQRQHRELIQRRGGDQGNYAGARPVEKVGKYGRLIKSYDSIREAATDNGLCEDTIKGHCIRYHKAKKYFTKEGFTFRFKKQ